MSHPFYDTTKTGQERADARYGAAKTPSLRAGPVIADAERNPTGKTPDEAFNGAPARQISNLGKVRK